MGMNEMPEKQLKARSLYWQYWTCDQIADELGVSVGTVRKWRKTGKWDDVTPAGRVEHTIEAALVGLINKPDLTSGDFKRMDLLARQMERLARIRRYGAPDGSERDLNPKIEARYAPGNNRAKRAKNYLDAEAIDKLKTAFAEGLFEYQRAWASTRDHRARMILKSRQIGATWYFAREALIDAIETGRNQIFLSASKAQAHVFKTYIKKFVMEVAGVELKGDPIILNTESHVAVELHFLGSNARTAQGYHGNFYFDEFFWSCNFAELNKVASAMAMHKKWRKTWFSTPSSTDHQAYEFWSGDHLNRKRAADQQLKISVEPESLKTPKLCEDKVTRHVVTIEDAEAGGCDLFDIEELRHEYSPDQFNNLLMCQFMSDSDSLFPLSEMQRCMVDSWVEWASFFKPLAPRPLGDAPVWIGYDPSESSDSAGLVVVAPPAMPGGKFRMVERHQFKNGMLFEQQAAMIREVSKRYNVTYIGIDSTGIGAAVLQLVTKWFPAVTELRYSLEMKTLMVLKAGEVIRSGRLQFDSGWTDVAASFMAIRKTLTASGRSATYTAGRTQALGHADLAWATMHVLYNEPLGGQQQTGRNLMEIS